VPLSPSLPDAQTTSSPTPPAWVARVRVTLTPVVNDPAGLSIAQALHHLGFDGVTSVRTGKYFEIELDAADKSAAEQAADAMCRQLLANPVVERYAFTVARPRR
jgi:phosphoribosylformylglycinamidine synthase PurS subunit